MYRCEVFFGGKLFMAVYEWFIPERRAAACHYIALTAVGETDNQLEKIETSFWSCLFKVKAAAFWYFSAQENNSCSDTQIKSLPWRLLVHCLTRSVPPDEKRWPLCSPPRRGRSLSIVHCISSGRRFPSSYPPLSPSMLTGSIPVFWPQCPCKR